MDSTTTIIRPSPDSFGKTTRLSVIDQIAPRDYNSIHFFFRLPPNADKALIFKNLEDGLLITAYQIPQLMCCICKADNDRDELELRYSAKSGATIAYRDYTSPKLRDQWPHGNFDDLEREHFPLTKLERQRVLAATPPPGAERLPALAVQANFIEGGLILTACLHHTVCDGTGVYIFSTAFSKNVAAACRGEPAPQTPEATISFLERESVVAAHAGVKITEFENWKPVGAGGSFLNPTSFDAEKYPPVKYATYFISEPRVQELRQRLASKDGKKSSSIEAVGAFLWMHTVRSRKIDLERYPEAKLSVTVDARVRMQSKPVCAMYWGNFSEPNAVARIPTKMLVDGSDEATPSAEAVTPLEDVPAALLESLYTETGAHCPTALPAPGHDDVSWNITLPEASRRIRKAIAAVDDTAVRRLVGLLQQMDKCTSLTWNVDRWPGPDMLIVCLNNTRFNDLDFGPQLGCSEAFRFTVGDTEGKPDGRCLILPPRKRDGKGLEVMVQYDVETLSKLERSREFGEFFERRN